MGKVADEFKLFFQIVSVRGVPRIFTSRQIVIAGFWLVTVLIFLAIFLWQMCLLMLKYFSYPSSSSTREESTYPIFPALSICNLNPILMVTSNFTSILSWPQHLDNVQNVLKKADYKKMGEAFGNMSKDDLQKYIRDLESAGGYFSNFPIYEPQSEDGKNDMILDYSILDWNWMRSNATATITSYWDSNYFHCYSLNLKKRDRNKAQMISLVVYVNNFPEYVLPGIYQLGSTDSKAVGASLRIHFPGTRGNMKLGINLSPGTESTFYIEMINRTRLKYPYNKWNCTDENDKGNTGYLYNINDCIELCIQEQIVNKCGCISIDHIFTKAQLVQANKTLCGNMSDFGKSDSLYNGPGQSNYFYATRSNIYPDFLRRLACMNTLKISDNDACIKRCLLPCVEITYKYTGMTADWPDVTSHLPLFRQFVKTPTSNYINKTNFIRYEELDDMTRRPDLDVRKIIEELKGMTTIRDNFLQINVVFQSRYSHYIEDSETITSQSLLSSIGGCLSLWLGLSFMTIAEVVEFIIRLVKATAKVPIEVKPVKDQRISF